MAKKKTSQANPAKGANPMWGGHYAHGPAEAFAAINPSLDVDKRLYRHDIMGSLAHCQMLEQQKIISKADSAKIQKGLKQILQEIESGTFTFDIALEDIHMNIEARIKTLIGDAAGRLHTARSRNDQVATSFRLYLRDALAHTQRTLVDLQSAIITQAEAHVNTLMPGYTHLQAAQPISFAHHLMAYVEMFGRDHGRLTDAASRLSESPLGAAALAGTTYPIDRHATAKSLGFAAPMANSLDAVSSRDFALEVLAALAIAATHLSRLAEELVIWTSPQYQFISLPENFTSGSSIMPQKRNPDAAELVRGKTGRIIGNLNALLVTVKALPLAYNKDLQEDKYPVFDSLDQFQLCAQAMVGMISGMKANAQNMRAATEAGFLTATDLADWLVQQLGLPFRDAHHITGRVVKLAEQRGITLEALSLKDMQKIDARFTKSVFDVLPVAAAVSRRASFGGTSPAQVKKAIQTAKKKFL